MSLLSTIWTGGSGLQTNQKWAEITGRNIANANTPGYHRKDVQFGSRIGAVGGGAYVSDVSRSLDSAMNRMYRFESGKMHHQDAIAKGLHEYSSLLGQPNDERNISSSLAEMKESFIRLSNSPSSVSVQRTVVMAAEDLTYSLRETNHGLQTAKNENEIAIQNEVETINRQMNRLAELNSSIHISQEMRADSVEMLDERDQLIDDISESMNIRVMEYDDGRVTVYTGGGTTLVEGTTAYGLEYDEGNGKISSGGINITPDPQSPAGFEHGRLAGLLELKNEVLPQFQLQLDEMARGVITAFEDADASLAPGQAGLYTDAGNAFDPAELEGLAGRIAVNDAVKTENGGSLWRVREGIGATSQQGGSFLGQVEDFLDVFEANHTFDSDTGMQDLTLNDYASNMVAFQAVAHSDAENRYDSAAVTTETLGNARISMSGVSIDDELQKMMLIEQSYSANTQVIQTAASMLDQLISIA